MLRTVDEIIEIEENNLYPDAIEPPPAPPCFYNIPDWLNTAKPYAIKILSYTIAATTAVPSTIYALMYPSGESVNALGASWWKNMTTGNKVFSVVTCCAAFATNIFTNVKYLGEATNKLKDDFAHCCTHPTAFMKTCVYLILASSAALSAATLSYDAFIEFGQILAISMALFQLLAYGTRRYAGTTSFFNRLYNVLSSDMRFQRGIASEIEQIDERYHSLINHLLDDLHYDEINDENILEIIELILNQAQNTEETHFFKQIDTSQWLLNNSLHIFDFTLSATLAYFYYLLNGQKGYDGINIITKLITGNNISNDFPVIAKQCIAFLPGIASSMQVAVNGMDFRAIYTSVYQHIKDNPRDIIKALLLITSSGLAATAMATAASGVVSKENLFSLTSDSTYGEVFVAFNWLGNFVILGNATIQQSLLPEKNHHSVKIDSLVEHIKTRSLSEGTLEAIKKHGLFANTNMPAVTLNSENISGNSSEKEYGTFIKNSA